MTGGDGGHGTRGAWKNGGERLAEADPDGLGEGHLVNIACNVETASGPCIDDPHHDAADEQGQGDGLDAAEIFLAPLVQQQGGDRSDGEGDEGEGDGMGEQVAIAVFAPGKCAQESADATEEEE